MCACLFDSVGTFWWPAWAERAFQHRARLCISRPSVFRYPSINSDQVVYTCHTSSRFASHHNYFRNNMSNRKYRPSCQSLMTLTHANAFPKTQNSGQALFYTNKLPSMSITCVGHLPTRSFTTLRLRYQSDHFSIQRCSRSACIVQLLH